jgi:hypothetical protein
MGSTTLPHLRPSTGGFAQRCSRPEHCATERAVVGEPDVSRCVGHRMVAQHIAKKFVTAIEVPLQDGRKTRVRLRHRAPFVDDVGTERARREVQLMLDEFHLVTTREEETHDEIREKAVVKIAQDDAHPVEASDERHDIDSLGVFRFLRHAELLCAEGASRASRAVA